MSNASDISPAVPIGIAVGVGSMLITLSGLYLTYLSFKAHRKEQAQPMLPYYERHLPSFERTQSPQLPPPTVAYNLPALPQPVHHAASPRE
ncbi:hypothetical protein G7054_g10674 [Neopestalotiopsis clavispora]|nr:hypothetical protein G7054_g10674 [Neopestalotiopsis clavispora]